MNGVIKAAVQVPPKVETSGVLKKGTGFPEPLSQNSNTTLPHPAADTSPDACIESADVPTSRTHSRHSSFQLRSGSGRPKAKGPLASGLISATNGLPLPDDNGVNWADGSTERHSGEGAAAGQLEGNREGEGGREGREGQTQGQETGTGRDEQGYREGERKKGLLRKMQLHKT